MSSIALPVGGLGFCRWSILIAFLSSASILNVLRDQHGRVLMQIVIQYSRTNVFLFVCRRWIPMTRLQVLKCIIHQPRNRVTLPRVKESRYFTMETLSPYLRAKALGFLLLLLRVILLLLRSQLLRINLFVFFLARQVLLKRLQGCGQAKRTREWFSL